MRFFYGGWWKWYSETSEESNTTMNIPNHWMVCFTIINLMVRELYLNKAAIRIKGKLNVFKSSQGYYNQHCILLCPTDHPDYNCLSHACLTPHVELLGGRDICTQHWIFSIEPGDDRQALKVRWINQISALPLTSCVVVSSPVHL